MRPLLVRRAGEFEKTMFDLSTVVGVLGLFPDTNISSSVDAVFSFATWWFFALLIVAGVGGRAVTWRSDRDRSIIDIEHECGAEGMVLGVLSGTWLIYGIGSAQLINEGRSAIIPLLFSLSIVGASIRRGWRIWRDLRKIKRALRAPETLTMPTALLGDPDDNSDEEEPTGE